MSQGRFFLFQISVLMKSISLHSRRILESETNSLLAIMYITEQDFNQYTGEYGDDLNSFRTNLMQPGFFNLEFKDFSEAIAFRQAVINLLRPS
jgi:hypothetical protein